MRLAVLRTLAVVLLVGSAACSTVNKHVSKGFDAYAKYDYALAEKEFLKAIEDDKDDPYAQLNLGALYQATGRPQLAVDLYMKVLETGKNIRPNRKTANSKTQAASPTLAEIAQANLNALAAVAQKIQ
jgi:tetratricopeptide (TPR) repeat protein